MQDFEKLGAFYLGREYDIESGSTRDELVLYDAKDLTTHALCVGMTGSGKTGLGVGLLEEAAIDGIPAIVIDPKGDMGNLLLTFPQLRPEDFRPWVDPGAATREGLNVDTFAARTAETWKKGIGSWGQDAQRIRNLKEAADVAIYTPGSSAGLQLSVLRSFSPPPAALLEDPEAFADRIQASVAGLMALLGIKADPIQSRESILISNLLKKAWEEGRELTIADLIREIQSPPFERLGVLDVESFFPAKERFELAMSLNNLLASPGFSTWLEGEALNVERLLHTEEGKPRISILSIAHLSEAERMFFVTILLNEVLAWVRTQSGTSSLRALLYMDEIFGYFPPTQAPPSKKPMLTLLKQARAFGLGVVLATQNPVDLDYKGLSNTGTWFIGRLQTERDKLRVLDGLEGAMTGGGKSFDRKRMDAILSGLGKRIFLMNNVHEDHPVVFSTRWVLSYLRGPMTREEIKLLMAPRKAEQERAPAKKVQATARPPEVAKAKVDRPMLPAGIPERFQNLRDPLEEGESLLYKAALYAEGRLHYASTRSKVDLWKTVSFEAWFTDEAKGPDWEDSTVKEDPTDLDLSDTPQEQGRFDALPARASHEKSYTSWRNFMKRHLYENHPLVLFKNADHKLISEPGESESAFRVRVVEADREVRDLQIEKLRSRYAPKLARLEERVRKAEARLDKEEEQYAEKKRGSLISFGTSLLGALFSRKKASSRNVSRAGTALRSADRAAKEKGDIRRAKADLEKYQDDLKHLEAEFEEEVQVLSERLQATAVELDEVVVRPRKADITLDDPMVIWKPWRVGGRSKGEPAY